MMNRIYSVGTQVKDAVICPHPHPQKQKKNIIYSPKIFVKTFFWGGGGWGVGVDKSPHLSPVRGN